MDINSIWKNVRRLMSRTRLERGSPLPQGRRIEVDGLRIIEQGQGIMRIKTIRTLAGPNIYHHQPVLVMKIDLEGLTDTESREIAGFNERLINVLPGLREHRCSRDRRGGFIERLWEGKYFGHFIKH